MGDLHSLVTTKTTLGDNCNDNSTNTSIDNKNEAEVVEVIEANHKNCPIRRIVQNQKKKEGIIVRFTTAMQTYRKGELLAMHASEVKRRGREGTVSTAWLELHHATFKINKTSQVNYD